MGPQGLQADTHVPPSHVSLLSQSSGTAHSGGGGSPVVLSLLPAVGSTPIVVSSVPTDVPAVVSAAPIVVSVPVAPCVPTVSSPGSAPLTVDPRVAVERARMAAALSPYASPRCAPQVLLAPDGPAGLLCLRVRGFVFDREHAPRYRSDVSARFLAMNASGSGELGAPGTAALGGSIEAAGPVATAQ